MIEINAHPQRLDLDWIHCKRAKALGVQAGHQPRRPQHRRPGAVPLRRGRGPPRLAEEGRRVQHAPGRRGGGGAGDPQGEAGGVSAGAGGEGLIWRTLAPSVEKTGREPLAPRTTLPWCGSAFACRAVGNWDRITGGGGAKPLVRSPFPMTEGSLLDIELQLGIRLPDTYRPTSKCRPAPGEGGAWGKGFTARFLYGWCQVHQINPSPPAPALTAPASPCGSPAPPRPLLPAAC